MIEATVLMVAMLASAFSGAAVTDLLNRRNRRGSRVVMYGTTWVRVGYAVRKDDNGSASLTIEYLPAESVTR